DGLDLKSQVGLALLNWFFLRESAHEQMTFHIVNLLSQVDAFSNFIAEYQNRDRFMEVEENAHLQFRALYKSCEMTSLYLNEKWELESLGELYKKDKTEWKNENVWLHEGTLDYALTKIDKLFPSLVGKLIKLVTETQHDYWLRKDPAFLHLCSNALYT